MLGVLFYRFERHRPRMKILKAVWVRIRVGVKAGWVDARRPVPALTN